MKNAKSAEKAILVVSFGTSYNDSCEKTIGAIENSIAEEFPDYDVRRAFTSRIIKDKLKKRDNTHTDSVAEALERAESDGITTLVVQPTHIMSGYEYEAIKNDVEKYEGKFGKLILAKPLLSCEKDFEKLAEALVRETSSYDDGNTAICFMGHGTSADSNSVYATLQAFLTEKGLTSYHIGTVEATPSLEDVMSDVKNGNYKRVFLLPLMVVAGDHANNDMAGDGRDSWKSRFESDGYEVECVLKGLGEYESVREIYAKHTHDALS